MLFRTGLSFDMRAPDFGAPPGALYEAALEMIEYADAHGIEQVIFPEHHFSEDGYNPVPALMGAAAGARTGRMAIVLGAIVLPIHDPVKVAETIAVTDLICGGRLHTVLAAGYFEPEFETFGRSLRDRAKLMDRGLDVISRALAGERFRDGDREVFVRPLPSRRPPHLYVGGGVAASARRAARFGLGFWGLTDDLVPVYEEECRRLGRDSGPVLYQPMGVHVAEDPEAAWAQLAPHVAHLGKTYSTWASDYSKSSSPFHGLGTAESVRAAGIIEIATPDECVELARRRPISLIPLVSGLAPEVGWKSLELFVAKALPQIRKESPGAPALG